MDDADPDGQPPAEHLEPPRGERERLYPSTVGGAFYLLVLAVTACGVVLGSVEDWRLGVRICGAAMIAAGALRLMLPQRDAGMLAVRNRYLDVLILAAIGGALIFLAGDIPGRTV